MGSLEIKDNKIRHYVQINNMYVIKGFSSVFQSAKEADICIYEDGGRHFELNGEINPPLRNEQGAPLYKWTGTQIVETTEEEQQAYIDALPSPPKTEMETMKEEMNELGQQLAQEKIANMQKTNTLNNLGQELTQEKLSNMGKTNMLNSLGQEVSGLKLEIMMLKGGAN